MKGEKGKDETQKTIKKGNAITLIALVITIRVILITIVKNKKVKLM